jgi:inosine/xanthosine triphosphatase
MLLAVGSRNPVKVEASRLGFTTFWPHSVWKVTACASPSGVRDQPMSDDEARDGATARAHHALHTTAADFGVGLEGGLHKHGAHWFNSGWAVVVSKSGLVGVATTIRMAVPARLMEYIEQGCELGVACDLVFDAKNSKQDAGHYGLMTAGLIDRTGAFRDAVVAALADLAHTEGFCSTQPFDLEDLTPTVEGRPDHLSSKLTRSST